MAVSKSGRARRIRLHIGIASIFVVIVAALTVAIVWNNDRQASAAALRTADQLFHEISTKVDERMNGMLGAVKASVDAASAMPGLAGRPRYDGLSHPALETMVRMIEALPHVFSVFVGFGSGEWLQVSAPRGDPDISATFLAPEGTHFIIRTISNNRDARRHQYLRYLDRDRHVIGARSETDPVYDPRGRDWYKSALATEQAVFSDPYIFFRLKKPGITTSRRLTGGSGVFAVAVTLSNFSQFLAEQSASANAELFLFNSRGEILAHQSSPLAAPIAQEGHSGESDRVIISKADESGSPIVQSVVRERLAATDGSSTLKRLQVAGQTYLVRTETVGKELGVDQYIGIAAPLSDFTQHIAQMRQRNIITSILALAIALPLIFLIARRIAAKLASLAVEADKIRRFELDSPVDVESRFLEVYNLSQAFDLMKKAVRVFGQYVPRALVQEIVQSGTAPERGGQRQEITVLFTDISNFTRIAESTEPEDLMLRTSEYFEALGAVLSQHHGVVDKYIGDAVMALWNAPSHDEDHVRHACAAVLACREVSHELAEKWTEKAIPAFHTRFGLHCGEAVVGNVGGADRLNFTAVGATINLASRLEALNKRYGTEILVSEAVVASAGERYLMRRIDRVQPAGVNRPTDIYELIAAHPDPTNLPTTLEASEAQRELCSSWNEAYATYLKHDWQSALVAFETVLKRFPEDNPSQILAERCRSFSDTPPDPDWDGVTRLSQK